MLSGPLVISLAHRGGQQTRGHRVSSAPPPPSVEPWLVGRRLATKSSGPPGSAGDHIHVGDLLSLMRGNGIALIKWTSLICTFFLLTTAKGVAAVLELTGCHRPIRLLDSTKLPRRSYLA